MTMFDLAHLIGTIVGFLAALVSATIIFTHGFLSPVTEKAVHILRHGSSALLATLLIVWGTAFLQSYEMTNSFFALYSTEVMKTKILLIALVTLNTILFNLNYVEPLKSNKNVPFLRDAEIASVVVIATSICMSLATWVTLVVLGLQQSEQIVIHYEGLMDAWLMSNLVAVSVALMLIAVLEFYNEKKNPQRKSKPRRRALHRLTGTK